MVRLNKNQLSNKQHSILLKQLATVLGSANSKQMESVLSDLLGNEEKIMLAKRIGMVILFLEGCNANQVATTLKVSRATAGQVRNDLEADKLNNLVDLLKKSKRDYFAILNAIDSVLHLGGVLPHYGKKQRNLKKYLK